MVGHTFPLFLRFRGGKAVATGAGAMLGLAPVDRRDRVSCCGSCSGLVTRYVSVASMLSAVAFVLLAIVDRPAVADRSRSRCSAAGLVFWRHRANIAAAARRHRAPPQPAGAAVDERRCGRRCSPASIGRCSWRRWRLDEPRAGRGGGADRGLGALPLRPARDGGRVGGAAADGARPRGLRRGRGGGRRACTSVAPGDRVVLCWYAPCGECARCRDGPALDLPRTRAPTTSLMPDGGTRLRRLGGEPVRSYLAVGSFGRARGGAGVRRGAGAGRAAGGAGRADRLRRRHRRGRGARTRPPSSRARAWS